MDAKRIKYRYELLLTSYDSGCYSLSPIPIVINNKDTICTQRFNIIIKDMVTDIFKQPLYGIKAIMYKLYCWKDYIVKYGVYFPFLGLGLVLLGMVGIFFLIEW